MAFVPTERQINSLHFLLKQLLMENIAIRVIRFEKWVEGDIRGCEIEICCLEDEDRYKILWNGKIIEG